MKTRISSQWMHDNSAYFFPRTSGLSRSDFESPRVPWARVALAAVIALALILAMLP